ncbi:hypothetical protein D9M70_477960 [compost metagenome]
MVLAGLHGADAVPERAVEGVVAVGQQRDVVDQLVGVVVLGLDAAGARLQAHVDVLGHQDHGVTGLAGLQLDQLVDDLVVVEVFRQPGDRLGALAHEDRQEAAAAAGVARDRHAVLDLVGRCAAEDLVDQADGLPAFGRDALLAALQLVQLLQHRHRDGDVVLLEVEQGVGIVDQNVGIEGVERGGGGAGASVIIHTRSPSARARRRRADMAPAFKRPPNSRVAAREDASKVWADGRHLSLQVSTVLPLLILQKR